MAIDPWAYLFAAALLLMLPLKWVLAAFLAAAFHELCHMAAVKCMGGHIKALRLTSRGMQMDVRLPGKKQEFAAAVAGPLGSFFLAFLYRWIPEISVCACIQGIYNAMPIYPLDGGRALACLTDYYLPEYSERFMAAVAWLFSILLFAVSVWISVVFSAGWTMPVLCLLMICRLFLRKIPCNDDRIGVQ